METVLTILVAAVASIYFTGVVVLLVASALFAKELNQARLTPVQYVFVSVLSAFLWPIFIIGVSQTK